LTRNDPRILTLNRRYIIRSSEQCFLPILLHDTEEVLLSRRIGLNYENYRPMAITKWKVLAHSLARDSESFNSTTVRDAEKVLPVRHIRLNHEDRRALAITNGRSRTFA
jgi:hypothetical protein